MSEDRAKELYIASIFENAVVEAARELVALIHSSDPRVALEACREVLARVG